MNKFIKEGGKSFHENEGRYRNPYARGSGRHNDFERGWSQAVKRSPDSFFNEYGETNGITSNLIEDYERERRVAHRDEVYRVRDNGAIFREPKEGGRRRSLDGKWTFGRPCKSTGYMNLAGQKVHRVVALAFHGEAPSDKYVVDHIDTNRRNNRAGNLRWITRLENILMNPITLRRIELSYGSLDEFLQNPSEPKGTELPQNYEWMRTVSKQEAKASIDRIQKWVDSGKSPKGGQLGEWIYSAKTTPGEFSKETTKQSLTPGAFQRNWWVPTEFPLCPDGCGEDSLSLYEALLAPGEIFCRSKYGASKVVIAELSGSGQLCVITMLEGNAVKQFAVALVVRESESIIHESGGTFFSLKGAAKAHCRQLDVPGEAYCERSSLPWGESIDDYC